MIIQSSSGRPYTVLYATPEPYQLSICTQLDTYYGWVGLHHRIRILRTDGATPKPGIVGLVGDVPPAPTYRKSFVQITPWRISHVGPGLLPAISEVTLLGIKSMLKDAGTVFSGQACHPDFFKDHAQMVMGISAKFFAPETAQAPNYVSEFLPNAYFKSYAETIAKGTMDQAFPVLLEAENTPGPKLATPLKLATPPKPAEPEPAQEAEPDLEKTPDADETEPENLQPFV